MEIIKFISLSEGEWKSMRSGHSLAFQHFEEVLSKINIEIINIKDPLIQEIISSSPFNESEAISPFRIDWEAESNWDSNDNESLSVGTCYLIPIPESEKKGKIIRTLGYSERIKAISNYQFLNDGTFSIQTKYDYTLSEEKIWFASKNVRCRSSIISSLDNQSIIQTSFASEIRKINQ